MAINKMKVIVIKAFSSLCVLLTRAVLLPSKVTTDFIRLGSEYGGWKLVPPQDANEVSEILSFGLGEDASFDIEVCDLFNSRVHICDPTPRAIMHFNQICENFGNSKSEAYSKTGKQSIDSYPLSNTDHASMIFLPLAIWKATGIIRLYFPTSRESVSMSINFDEHNQQSSENFLDVKSIRVKELIELLDIEKIELVKLDIEGAELEVLKDMLESGVFPRQILTEFDFLLSPKASSLLRFFQVQLSLRKSRYRMFAYEYPRNFSYIRLD